MPAALACYLSLLLNTFPRPRSQFIIITSFPHSTLVSVFVSARGPGDIQPPPSEAIPHPRSFA